MPNSVEELCEVLQESQRLQHFWPRKRMGTKAMEKDLQGSIFSSRGPGTIDVVDRKTVDTQGL